jgi:sialic acid synthase
MPPRSNATLIAEVGCNHMGDMALARQFIDVAAGHCQVPVIKFQKRHNRTLLPESQYNAPHPVPHNSFGDTYGEHREYLEFDLDQHRELQRYCADKGVVYACSVWDLPSLDEIGSLSPPHIKIPSATNTNLELLDEACRHFDGQIHISLGMTTADEEKAILEVCRTHDRTSDVVLYACTSGYPIEASDAYLLEITRIREAYLGELAAVGFSGHHKGISIDVAAFTLGATFIERHFTLDRTWKGTDHAASLEPDGMRRLQRDLTNVAQALQSRTVEILPIEEPQRNKLKWRG